MEQTGEVIHAQAVSRKDRELQRKRKILESKIESLKSEYESAEEELNKVYVEEALKKQIMGETISKIADLRRGDDGGEEKNVHKKNK
jgi:circadian clock protein KaiC